MPWYDYECKKCNHIELDVLRKITEEVSTYICPSCGSLMHQKYSAFGFELKGTGWYKSDYTRKNIKKNT